MFNYPAKGNNLAAQVLCTYRQMCVLVPARMELIFAVVKRGMARTGRLFSATSSYFQGWGRGPFTVTERGMVRHCWEFHGTEVKFNGI